MYSKNSVPSQMEFKWCFGATFNLILRGLHGVISQKLKLLITTAARISNVFNYL
jgi:hypothetical protein